MLYLFPGSNFQAAVLEPLSYLATLLICNILYFFLNLNLRQMELFLQTLHFFRNHLCFFLQWYVSVHLYSTCFSKMFSGGSVKVKLMYDLLQMLHLTLLGRRVWILVVDCWNYGFLLMMFSLCLSGFVQCMWICSVSKVLFGVCS